MQHTHESHSNAATSASAAGAAATPNTASDNDRRRKRRGAWPIVLLLVALIGVVCGNMYAYWAGNVANPQNHADTQEITIGKGKDVTTELEVGKQLLAQGKKLVPAGKVAVSTGGAAANVESFTAKYTVYWKETGADNAITAADLVQGNLNVTETHTIEGAEQHKGLVNVTVTPTSQRITADGTAVEVTVTVKLTEPADKTTYDAISGGTIRVNLTFSVAQ